MWIIIYSIGVYRLTFLLYEDDGPFDALTHLRAWAGISHKITHSTDEFNNPTVDVEMVVEDNFFAKLLGCPYCISMWLAAFATVGIFFAVAVVTVYDLPAVWLCIAGLVHFTLKKMYY